MNKLPNLSMAIGNGNYHPENHVNQHSGQHQANVEPFFHHRPDFAITYLRSFRKRTGFYLQEKHPLNPNLVASLSDPNLNVLIKIPFQPLDLVLSLFAPI